MFGFVVLLVVTMLVPLSSYAAIRYVSPSGTGPSPACTDPSPCSPLQGLQATQSGDTLYFKAGTYSYHISYQDVQFASGTSWDNPVTIAGKPGDIVTLTAGIDIYAEFPGAPTVQYVIFDNFVLDGVGFHLTRGNMHHIRFQNSEVKNVHVGGSGVGCGQPAHDIEFINLHVHDNGVVPNPWGHGFYISGLRVTVRDSDIHDNWGYGIQLYDSGVQNCCDEARIYNNKIHHNSTMSGCGTGAATLNYSDNIEFFNNLVYDTPGGVGVSRLSTNMKIYNNTFYGITDCAALGLDDNTSGTIIKNNIFINVINTVDLRDNPDTIFASNLCSSTSPVGCTHAGDPLFTNAAAGNFKIENINSAARNNGVPLTWPLDIVGYGRGAGGAWDIGAYEYQEGGTLPFDFLVPTPTPVSVAQGSSITFPVVANYNGGTAAPVTFTVSGLPSGVTHTASTNNPCTPSCTATLTLAAAGGAPPGTFTALLTGTSGVIVRSANFSITVVTSAPSFDFSIGNPGAQTVQQGSAIVVPLTLALVSGTAVPVTLTVTAGLPSGVTTSFSNVPCTPPCPSAVTLTASGSATIGTTTLTIHGVGGAQSHDITFDLTVTGVITSGNPIYVAQSGGNDNNSCTAAESQSTPKLTLTNAICTCMNAAPGKRLIIKAGTYVERIDTATCPIKGGDGPAFGNATTIETFGNDAVTIRLPVVDNPVLFFRNGVNDKFIVVKGSPANKLVIDGNNVSGSNGIACTTGGHHLRFEHVEVKNTTGGYETVYNAGCSNFEMVDSYVHHAGTSGIAFEGDMSDNLIQRVAVYNNGTRGINFKSGNQTSTTIRESIIHHNATDGIFISTSTNAMVFNSIVQENSQKGIHIATGAVSPKLRNNTIYSNGTAGVQCDSGATSVQVTNVMSYGNATNLVDNCTMTQLTNRTGTSNPFFVSAPTDLRLTPNQSDGINAGTNIPSLTVDYAGLPRQQDQQDIGAHETTQAPPGGDTTVMKPSRRGESMFFDLLEDKHGDTR